ncbi:MAG: hypothetical protein EXQ74_01515 [Thermoleophilia bacterium]|nr:hypothetical protein [Thermoleophilia bacterium]
MVVRILLAALFLGLGVYYGAPLMPVGDATAHAVHEEPCAECTTGDHDGMGIALAWIGIVAAVRATTRGHHRFMLLVGRYRPVPCSRMIMRSTYIRRTPPPG